MKKFYSIVLIFTFSLNVRGYSKYGRTCKDIGCSSNEECIMAETPCSYYTRQDECGMYPTCKRVGNSAPSCASYVCPPTKKCIVDGDTPKCVDDAAAHTPDNPKVHQTLQTYNDNDNQNYNPSPPQPAQPNYPALPSQTTTRRPIQRPQSGNGGYSGGSIGSGYPGQPGGGYQGGAAGSGYPGQGNAGYPQQQGGQRPYQGGYQQPGYQQPGYQQPGYQQPGYQQPGYQPGYQGGYQNNYQGGYQGGYNPYGQQPQKPQKSASNPIVDALKNSLTNFGLFCLSITCTLRAIYGY